MANLSVSKKIIREILRFLGLNTNMRLFLMSFFDESSKHLYEVRNHKFSFDEMCGIVSDEHLYPKNILSVENTISKIISENLSVSRLGDGEEFAQNLLNANPKFPELKKSLQEILKYGSSEKCLVCINNFNVFDEKVPMYYRRAFAYYWIKNPVNSMTKSLSFNTTSDYGDAYAFLFYFSEADTKEETIKKSKYIAKIWEGKKVLFVISKHSKIPLDKSYFNGTAEKAFIFAPRENAYSEYNRIFRKITENYSQDWLVYLELGACATVLSSELSKLGYQALDMGDFYKRIVYHRILRNSD